MKMQYVWECYSVNYLQVTGGRNNTSFDAYLIGHLHDDFCTDNDLGQGLKVI